MRTIASVVLAGLLYASVPSFAAEEANVRTVGSLYQDKAALAGQLASVKGKVVKVNNGIMGRNFVHVQDGTGSPETNNLVVTSKQTATVGDQVTVTGRVVVDRVFGAGYAYPLLLEDTVIELNK